MRSSLKKTFSVLFVVIAVVLLSACSHIAAPRGPIPVKMEVVGPIQGGKEVAFENGVTDAGLTLVAVQGSNKWWVDYKMWTGSVVSQLETELRNRGLEVKSESEKSFRVRVESVGLFWGSFSTRCIVKVRVEKKDGSWSKTYEGNNPSPASLYRSIDGAVYRAVVAILSDNDFRRTLTQ